MFTLFFILVALVILALAALAKGANTSDGVYSVEWRSRKEWFGFH